MNGERGYVLLFCLMLLGVLSLLTLSELRSAYIYSKTLAIRTQNHQQDYKLERQGRLLVNQGLSRIPRHCIGKERDMSEMIQALASGEIGCRFEKGKFAYWIEDLNIEDCLQITDENQTYASHHFRYTLMLTDDQRRTSMLQFHVIKKGRVAHCINKAYRLAPGLSSWRLIRL